MLSVLCPSCHSFALIRALRVDSWEVKVRSWKIFWFLVIQITQMTQAPSCVAETPVGGSGVALMTRWSPSVIVSAGASSGLDENGISCQICFAKGQLKKRWSMVSSSSQKVHFGEGMICLACSRAFTGIPSCFIFHRNILIFGGMVSFQTSLSQVRFGIVGKPSSCRLVSRAV